MTAVPPHPLDDNQSACTGCAACVVACVGDSITMQVNAEGFLYPRLNPVTCVDCGLCRRICPASPETRSPGPNPYPVSRADTKAFAAWQLDDTIRRDSSSGGVFTALAKNTLREGGVVVGAAFDDQLTVRHILVDNAAELYRLRGSKYVQSQLRPDLYREISDLLRTGRRVLFSGTPCEVAGLYAFLGNEYENLCTCDLICHGVPSPKVFDAYKAMLERQYRAKLRRISFRRKDSGWKRHSVLISFDNDTEYRRIFYDDPFMVGFLKSIYLRASCHACRFSCLPRIGDISLGDFWGINNHHPDWDDDGGTSLILVQTEKGRNALDASREELVVHEADLAEAIRYNPRICSSTPEGRHRAAFFNDVDRLPFEKLISKYLLPPPPLWRRAAGKLRRGVRLVIHKARKAFWRWST